MRSSVLNGPSRTESVEALALPTSASASTSTSALPLQGNWPALRATRLLDQVRERVRYLHYSLRTEQAYVYWVRAFVRFHACARHPREMGALEVEAFLTWLSSECNVSVSTHRQALSALLFLYQKVFGQNLPWMQAIGRPKRQARLPVVLSVDEVTRVLALMVGEHKLLAQLLYGTGMRISESLQLRVKDVDFERRTIVVRHGKGGKDRALMLPQAIATPLREQIARARLLWAAAGCAARWMRCRWWHVWRADEFGVLGVAVVGGRPSPQPSPAGRGSSCPLSLACVTERVGVRARALMLLLKIAHA